MQLGPDVAEEEKETSFDSGDGDRPLFFPLLLKEEGRNLIGRKITHKKELDCACAYRRQCGFQIVGPMQLTHAADDDDSRTTYKYNVRLLLPHIYLAPG